MEINKVIANSLNAADVKVDSKEQNENEEVKLSDIEETKDDDAALELEEENEENIGVENTEEEKTTSKEDKYKTKSTYMSNLLKPDDPNEDKLGTKEFVISEVISAKSIGELKDLLMNLQTLDMDTQLKVMDVINSLKFDDNLQMAKYKISSLLK